MCLTIMQQRFQSRAGGAVRAGRGILLRLGLVVDAMTSARISERHRELEPLAGGRAPLLGGGERGGLAGGGWCVVAEEEALIPMANSAALHIPIRRHLAHHQQALFASSCI